ncbi:MAG: hypothetical protein J6386_22820 [Candidatus Synoicihabitans palmerolidicus]|nr:hypothetical protein [Candidatus Synoicihabitans palmerolidicus]
MLTSPQEELAMMMWEEDERLRQLQDFNEQSDNALLLSGEEEAKALKALSQQTLSRSSYLPAPSALNRDRDTKGN